MATEPYSRSISSVGGGVNLGGQAGGASRSRIGRGRGSGPGRQGATAPGGKVNLSSKTLAEKLDLCCKEFNNLGCSRQQCRFMHKCSFVDVATNRVCFANHSRLQH